MRVDFNYLRPKKAAHLKGWYDHPFECRTKLNIYHYNNATVLPLKRFEEDSLLFGRGGVVDKQGNYIEESAIEARVQGAYGFEDYDIKDEKVVYCGYLVNQWGHFLVEGVCRLWYYLKNDNTIDKYVFFIDLNEDREIKGNYREFLELLGVWNRIEIINKPTKYREVVIPELSRKRRVYYSEEYNNTFEAVAKSISIEPTWTKEKKLFMTRSGLAKAREFEFGLDMLDSFFKNNGYKVLSPEKATLSELIYYIRNTDICASIAGSASHNILFAKKNQKFIIMEKISLNDDDQPDINRLKQLESININADATVYSTNFSGPCIFAYDGFLKKYAEDNSMLPPDAKYCRKKYIDKCFKSYMKTYLQEYGYKWYMMDWYITYNHADYIFEAYEYGEKMFSDYIFRKKPIFFYQYFQWHYIKQYFKRLLRK